MAIVTFEQKFDALSITGVGTSDTFSQGSSQQALTNSGSMHDGLANGVGFSTTWSSSGNTNVNGGPTQAGSVTLDAIGVAGGFNPAGGVAGPVSGADGGLAATDHYFMIEDPDGRADVTFDAIDLSTATSASFNIRYWVSATSWESNDNFNISVTDGVNSVDLLSLDNTALDAAESDETTPVWNTLNVADLLATANGGGLDLSSLNIVVSGDSNSLSEEFAIDNFVVTADIPAANVPADAIDDAFTATESAAFTTGNVFNMNPTTADTDPDDPLMVTMVNGSAVNVGTEITLGSGALLTLNGDGTFSYDPNGVFDDLPDFATSGASVTTATDSFTYELNGDDTATVTMTINGADSNADQIFGTAAVEALDGGTGTEDRVDYSASTGGVTVDLSIPGAMGVGGDAAGDTYANIEEVRGSNMMDVLTGNGDSNTLGGLDGDDQLNGMGGDDFLFGGSGMDTINGGDGNDHIVGGADNDMLNGDADNDAIYGGSGTDTINGGSGMDMIFGGADMDIIHGDGDADTIRGQGGDDDLYGDDGDDTLIGNVGLDELYGGMGNDTLRGQAGDDLLDGGEGNDRMFGGADADVFRVSDANMGLNRIGGFQDGVDIIRYEGLGSVSSFADLTITQEGANTKIEAAGTTGNIIVWDTTATDFTADDFEFFVFL